MKSSRIYFIVFCLIFVSSCLSKPPLPKHVIDSNKTHERIDSLESTVNTLYPQDNTSAQDDNSSVKDGEPTSGENDEPSSSLSLDLANFPSEVRRWIQTEIIPEYGDDLTISWLNDYKISVSVSNNYRTTSWFYGDSVSLVKIYGKHAKYQSLKYKYRTEEKVNWLLNNDAAYREIIELSKFICEAIQYDWGNFETYKGLFSPSHGKRLAVCDGYANEVGNEFLKLPCVKSVEKWTGANHAWNVVNLIDGRKLYVDLCWFDNETLNEETGEIEEKDDYNWLNVTYDYTEFKYSNVGYGGRRFCHAYGKFNKLYQK